MADPLLSFVGAWNAEDLVPRQQDEKLTIVGHYQNQLILNGKFLQLSHSGSFDGQPYSGTGFVGFDESTNQFREIWLDSLGHMVVVDSTSSAADANGLRLEGEFQNPQADEKMRFRSEYTRESDSAFVYRLVQVAADGSESVIKHARFSRV